MKKFRVLFLNVSRNSIHSIRAARDLGWEVHGLVMGDLNESFLEGRRKQLDLDVIHQIPTMHGARPKFSSAPYTHLDYEQFWALKVKRLVEKYEIDMIPPIIGHDRFLPWVARINEELGLPGIKVEQANDFFQKARYTEILDKAGIPVPMVYQVVPPDGMPDLSKIESYPVILKPSVGSGGFGVYVADTPEEVEWFFSPDERVHELNNPFLANHEMIDGRYRNRYYRGWGYPYMIQEYIRGPVYDMCAIVEPGFTIQCYYAYNITPTPPPFQSEFYFSTDVPDWVWNRLTELSADIEDAMNIDYGPLMFQTVERDGELYVFDMGLRENAMGSVMMAHSIPSLAYQKNVLLSMMPDASKCEGHWALPMALSYLPIPSGKITRLDIPYEADGMIARNVPRSVGDCVFEMKNDQMVFDRGYVAFVGKNHQDAKDKLQHFLQNECKIEVEAL